MNLVYRRKYLGRSSLAHHFKTYFARYGMKGFYNGFAISLIRTVPTGGLSFLVYEMVQEQVESLRAI